MKRFVSWLPSTVVAAALLVLPGLASAATLNVPGTYATIQAAVTAAAPGDTINVAAGTYAEHVSITKPLTLTGANAGIAGNGVRGAETIVDGTDTDAAFAITANNVTINGFTVKNGSNGGLFSGIWSQTGTQNSSIINNIITQNAIGVWAQCGANCLIEKNLFDANNKAGPSGGAAISADSTSGLTINNNEFKNHTLGNPILLQAVAPGAHTNIAVTNNNFHDNTNVSVIYALAITGGTFTNNIISPASDVTGISFSGADQNVTVTNNTITGGARGVRIEDAGYYGGSGGNSNITINRNSLATSSTYGVGNVSGYSGNVDATCNWWGAANGPSPVGPGSGSPVTAGVTYTSWLTTADLANGPCNGPIANMPEVHIFKYVDGVPATAANTNSATFPMETTFSSPNLGNAVDAPFTLSPTGWGSGDSAYEASFVGSNAGANYQTNEVLGGAVVGASCDGTHTYSLGGYSTGDTLNAAFTNASSTVEPSFTNLQSDKYVIVWNKLCTATTTPPTGTGEISGVKFEDWDADGSAFESMWEEKLSGWTIYLDTNNNNVLDSGEVATTTNAQGKYRFIGLAAGVYHVREVGQSGWVQITPASGKYDITLAAGQVVKNKNFGNFKLGSIKGMKFNDLNGNHKKDAGELGLAGWTIKLVLPNGTASTTVTDANGNYAFLGLMRGNYKLSEVMQTGWRQTVHPKPMVKIYSDTNKVNQNFGNKLKTNNNKNNDRDDDQDEETDN